MNQRVKTIFDEAQKRTPSDREELAELLQAAIDTDPSIEQSWIDEVADRVAAHERGEMTARPAPEVLAKYQKT